MGVPFVIVAIFVFHALGAYVNCYINEILFDGSIWPGWIVGPRKKNY